MTFGTALDRLTNIVIITAVVYVIGVAPRLSGPQSPSPQSPFAMGEEVPAISNVDYSKASATLVVFLRSSCIYCKQSIPFYQDLINSGKQKGANVQFVVVSLEDQLVIDAFLKDYDLPADRSSTVMRADWEKVASTPTLIAVDGTGLVMSSWVGQLGQGEQQEVRSTLGL